VDLAGSERSTARTNEKLFCEGFKKYILFKILGNFINKSLLTLETVIKKLNEGDMFVVILNITNYF
jgi:hypothetical protein